jgi:predicted kinase
MKLKIPELAVVALVGASGSGKSTFARKHFRATEVLSSDFCRGLVSDDENSQVATNDAFEVLHFIASKRLAAGKLVVIDATNVQPEARKPIVALARQFHCIPAAIVFDLPEKLCQERNRTRPDRDFGPHVIRQQSRQLRNALRLLEREGFRHVHILRSPEEIDTAEIVREPLWNNLKHEHGPFDIIGELYVYDTALRIGAKLNLFPARVYLHAGTRQGARALGLDARADALDMADLPREFHVLKPYEVEDVLCIFKSELASSRQTLGVASRRSWCA